MSRSERPDLPLGGLLVVDKPGGWTSHDVVARVRRLAGTRRVGHAGTLDPMATGVLVVGIERATKLLGYLAGSDKDYLATVRLGAATTTDDAEGEPVGGHPADELAIGAVEVGLAALTGAIEQVPSAVSAVKVGGVRSYARVRRGEQVDLPARRVQVSRLDLLAVRRDPPYLDVDLRVSCSTGTYVRALARDLGAGLGVGGHLTVLRRTRVSVYGLDRARPLDGLEPGLGDSLLPLSAAVADAFPRRDLDAEQARVVGHGGRLPAVGLGPGPVGVFAPDGSCVALVEERDGEARPVVVLAPV